MSGGHRLRCNSSSDCRLRCNRAIGRSSSNNCKQLLSDINNVPSVRLLDHLLGLETRLAMRQIWENYLCPPYYTCPLHKS
jgi:hypothetical protein